jgi:E3 ubiquitin-protein ligase CHFR
VQPCLHNFCGACFSEWVQRKMDCPSCRRGVTVVSRNHHVGSIVENYLSKHGGKRRDAAELARMDGEDHLGNQPLSLRKRERGEGADLSELGGGGGSASDRSDGSGSESDDEHRGLVELMRAGADAMRAAIARRNALRATCAACFSDGVLLRPLASSRFTGLPPAPRPDMPVARRSGIDAALPRLNRYERDVLANVMAQKNLSADGLLAHCLANVGGAGGYELPTCATGGPIPLDRPVCLACSCDALRTLAYQYRQKVPRDDLPRSAVDRSDCWYGWACRTQFHNAAHAERFNHVCSPSNRAQAERQPGPDRRRPGSSAG